MNPFDGKRILAPSDFSDRCVQAGKMAVELAGKAELVTVLHVAPDEAAFAAGDPAVVWETISEAERREELLGALKKRYAEASLEGVQLAVTFGRPAEEIVRIAESEGDSLIVLPSHGRRGLARLVIGSIAEHVVRMAHCPVLVMRDHGE
jgi:nucleotide-binding universal stress UspA family protein